MIEWVRKGHLFRCLMIALIGGWCCIAARGQHALYPTQFDLQQVSLLPGVFKEAQDLNYSVLLQYDVDRLLTPFVRQAGLSNTNDENNRYYQWAFEHPAFENFAWNPSMAMDGHITGHYLSALSLAYASCHDAVVRSQLKERLDYMVAVMKDCQNVFAKDGSGLRGFIGGNPDNEIWKTLYSGDYRIYNQRGNWVPLYCAHKTLAGLRDAYIYGENADAKEMFRQMCDWSIALVRLFTTDIMEMQILQWEPGAINEVLADAYVMFGDSKYLKAAEKYSHQIMIENMNADTNHEFLDVKQTNESTAKFVGFARIDEVKGDQRYRKASRLYWADVAQRRASAIGGVGVGSYFAPKGSDYKYVEEGDGPESCTSYNMLKLTERIFSDSRHPAYSEYYEKTLLNHILATLDPQTGGYGFYTSLRPESYHIYSTPNEAMWCCVGTGMENPSKFGEFIYTAASDTLFVNLFIASELNDKTYGLRQETNFPYGNKSKITVTKAGNYTIAVRHPAWTTNKYNIMVNGKAPKGFNPDAIRRGEMMYISCGKSWKPGDEIEITFPMSIGVDPCPGSSYISFSYGPMVLAAVTSSTEKGSDIYEELSNEYAGAGRRDNSPASRMKSRSLAYAPMLICDQQEIPSRLKVKDAKTYTFSIDVHAPGSPWKEVEIRPFFSIHHQRYTIYFNQQTESAFMRSPIYKSELRNIEIEEATFDKIDIGNEANESKHKLSTSETVTGGSLNEEFFRDCQPSQWIEFEFDCEKASQSIQSARDSVTLLCRFYVNDRGRECAISVDGEPIATYKVPSNKAAAGKEKFYDQPINIPAWAVQGKKTIRVRYAASNGFSPKLFFVRLMKNNPQLFL